jgi:hypothetical protein
LYDFLNPLELLIQQESNQHVSRITLNTQTHQNVHNTHFKGFELCHKYQETTKQELRKLPMCNLLSEFKEKVESKRSQRNLDSLIADTSTRSWMDELKNGDLMPKDHGCHYV